ncbi:MAG: type II secretion system F family protein [Bryobacteraceae bacterium]
MAIFAILILVFVGTFLAAALAVAASGAVLSRANPEADPRGEAALEGSPLLREEVVSTISLWARILKHFRLAEAIRARTAEAGLNWSAGRVSAMMLLAGTVALVTLGSIEWVPTLGLVTGTIFATLSPYLYVLRTRAKRFRKIEEQFPEALDSLSRALRAGHPLSAGLELLSRESPAPLSIELRRTHDEWKLGSSWDRALDQLAERVPITAVCVFAAAVKMQNRTGGKLNEVLGQLAETLREATALEGEVRSIAAHGRMTGRVLTILPVFIGGVMFVVNPEYIGILFTHPQGKDLIAMALGCLILAHFVIQWIVDIKL